MDQSCVLPKMTPCRSSPMDTWTAMSTAHRGVTRNIPLANVEPVVTGFTPHGVWWRAQALGDLVATGGGSSNGGPDGFRDVMVTAPGHRW